MLYLIINIRNNKKLCCVTSFKKMKLNRFKIGKSFLCLYMKSMASVAKRMKSPNVGYELLV